MILLRHGESEFNLHFSKTRQDPGIEDPAITETGIAQARQAAEKLKTMTKIAAVFASPYRRTLETAREVTGELGFEGNVAIEPLMREQAGFTCDIGTPASDLARFWPEHDFSALDEIWWHAHESEEQVGARAKAFYERHGHCAGTPDTLFVTHWGFIRALTGLSVPNGTLVRVDAEGRAEVVP